MSLKSKFFTMFTIAGATIAFSVVGIAQDKPATTAPADKIERSQKREGRAMGQRRGGHGEFGAQRRGPGMKRGGMMLMMLRGLELTDAQKTQIQSIMAANKPGQESREEMRTLMMAKRTGTLTTAQQERLTAIKTAAETKRQSVHQQIIGVLTPEQKAKIDQRKQQMNERMQQRKQMRDQKTPLPTTKP